MILVTHRQAVLQLSNITQNQKCLFYDFRTEHPNSNVTCRQKYFLMNPLCSFFAMLVLFDLASSVPRIHTRACCILTRAGESMGAGKIQEGSDKANGLSQEKTFAPNTFTLQWASNPFFVALNRSMIAFFGVKTDIARKRAFPQRFAALLNPRAIKYL